MQVKGSIDGSRHGRSFGASHRAYDRVRQGQGLKITDLPPDSPAILEYIIIIYVLNTYNDAQRSQQKSKYSGVCVTCIFDSLKSALKLF